MRSTTKALAILIATSQVAVGCASSPGSPAQVQVTIVEAGHDQPLPCRVHLRNERGEPQRVANLPFWRDHFVFLGSGAWRLPLGDYTYEIERGPEYESRSGRFSVGTQATLHVELRRITDLATDGWWSGDLHIHRPSADIELLMRAEDLYVAPVITWWNNRSKPQDLWSANGYPEEPLIRFDGNRFAHLMAGEDERDGGALLYFNLARPLDTSGAGPEYPDPMKFVEDAHRADPNVWIDVEKPFWWDVPVWLASGKIDSIGLANNHMCRSSMYASEAWGKPRDTKRLPAPRGNGFWTQEIYYHILNCGLRVPPSAGSASGVLPNPVGYNRVYVKVDGELTYDKWWSGLRAGRSFVTNGPLLIVTANGRDPGHVFRADSGPITIRLRANTHSRDPIDTVEIIKDGRVVQTISTAAITTLTFDTSGWFLVRAIAKNPKTFRFASTAPFFVEIGEQQRISKTSVQFFVDWIEDRIGRLKVKDPAQRRAVLRYHDAARRFWQARLRQANAK